MFYSFETEKNAHLNVLLCAAMASASLAALILPAVVAPWITLWANPRAPSTSTRCCVSFLSVTTPR